MIVQRLCLESGRPVDVMTAFTLAHLSDPHLPPLPRPRLRELAGKRALGYLNWTRNRHRYHRREVLDALVADMQAQAPDHIAVTGDLVNLALPRNSRRRGPGWRPSARPTDVTVVPGNHDAYVRATRHRFAESCRRISARRRCARTADAFRSCAGAGPWR